MSATIHPLPDNRRGPASSDGRRERSRSSRARIIEAMLDLVARGEVAPSAARVADRAGVGLRTVFRHFDDMESLHREMSERIEAQVLPITTRPFHGTSWRDRLVELAARRADFFEAILPYRISANLRRHQSAFLMADYVRLMRIERQVVEELLPPALLADRTTMEAIHVALSFQSWRVLRHDQSLPADAAAAVVRRMLDALLGSIDPAI